jgi:hypothetical protein
MMQPIGHLSACSVMEYFTLQLPAIITFLAQPAFGIQSLKRNRLKSTVCINYWKARNACGHGGVVEIERQKRLVPAEFVPSLFVSRFRFFSLCILVPGQNNARRFVQS